MIEPKPVVQNDSNLKNKLKNNLKKGFSLLELAVTMGIASIVSLGVATLFSYAIEQFTVIVEQNKAEENLLWAAYTLRSFVGQAVDTEITTATGPNVLSVADINIGLNGFIINQYDSTLPANKGMFQMVGVFGRENSSAVVTAVNNGAPQNSQLFSSGVYFFAPNDVAVGTSGGPYGGVLFFDLGGTGAWNANPLPVSPDLGDIWYDRFSEFRILEVECATPGIPSPGTNCATTSVATNPYARAAKSITFRIKTRYFKNSKREQWFYSTPAPAGVAPYRDIEMTVKVGFRNNVLVRSSDSMVGADLDERLMGGVYFFKMTLPHLSN